MPLLPEVLAFKYLYLMNPTSSWLMLACAMQGERELVYLSWGGFEVRCYLLYNF
jgi:hypothetical protein